MQENMFMVEKIMQKFSYLVTIIEVIMYCYLNLLCEEW